MHPISLVPSDAPITFFKGSKDQWRTLTASEQIIYPNLWDGISLKVAVTQEELKYTYEVEPYADPSQIKMHYEGATVKLKSPTELLVTTPSSEFTDKAPESFQMIEGRKENVELSYEFDEKSGAIGFTLGAFDPAQPLVIDPVILFFATLLGGDINDEGLSIAVDSTGVYLVGDIYAPGTTTITPFIGPDTTVNGLDGWIAKFTLDGTSLLYAGFIGGDGDDGAFGVAVDSTNHAYVTGNTSSGTNFPAVVGPTLTHHGGPWDGFICKVNTLGTGFDYCGFIGGSGGDIPLDVAVDSSNRAYVAGITGSSAATFPDGDGIGLLATFDGTYNGSTDGFAVRVNAAGTLFEYAGYIGGIGLDWPWTIDLDASGNAYVGGATESTQTTFPDGDGFGIVPGFDQTHNGGVGDDFLAKINAGGTALLYATYIGGTGDEAQQSVVSVSVRPTGELLFGGETPSSDLPTTVGPYLTSAGGVDAYFGQLNTTGTALSFLSYIGGTGDDYGGMSGFDSVGNIYVSGNTNSTQASFLPTPANGPDSTYNGGVDDAWVARFDPTGQIPYYSGYIGGSGSEFSKGAVTAAGVHYVFGATDSSAATFPDGDGFGLLPGYDQTPAGGFDPYLVKVASGEGLVVTITASVDQALTFNVADSALQFGTLAPTGARYATNSGGSGTETVGTTFTVETNAPGGFMTTLRGASLTNGANVIDALVTPAASSPGTEQFGTRLTASGGSGTIASPYNTANYAYTADATTAVTISSSTGPSTLRTHSMYFLANVSYLTPPLPYTATLTLVTTASF